MPNGGEQGAVLVEFPPSGLLTSATLNSVTITLSASEPVLRGQAFVFVDALAAEAFVAPGPSHLNADSVRTLGATTTRGTLVLEPLGPTLDSFSGTSAAAVAIAAAGALTPGGVTTSSAGALAIAGELSAVLGGVATTGAMVVPATVRAAVLLGEVAGRSAGAVPIAGAMAGRLGGVTTTGRLFWWRTQPPAAEAWSGQGVAAEVWIAPGSGPGSLGPVGRP
jgi:hypothetical protein